MLLCEDRFTYSDVDMVISDHLFNLGAENETMNALSAYFGSKSARRAEHVVPFTSTNKFSGAVYEEGETYLLGAPEIILGPEYERYKNRIEPHSLAGYRVLLLVMYDGDIANNKPEGKSAMPIALILLSNKIRDNAPETFAFFAKQGVTIKVISGDNPMTVSHIAKKAGIAYAEDYIDATTLVTESKIKAAARKYTVFGRVTPELKRKLIRALKAAGNTVAMTGDGVNDVLALKDADCGIAMASGSEVACQVSHLVLLNSDFASMPSVVMEGRRIINNIERSASLFLVKNIFSFSMALISIFAALPYPVSPAQLSMVSTITIGIPSFFLALEPNISLVKGNFLRNVLLKATPGGLTDILLILGVIAFSYAFDLSDNQMSTICAILLSVIGYVVLLRVCRPFTQLRKALCSFVAFALLFSILFLQDVFALHPITTQGLLVLVVFSLLSYPFMDIIYKLLDHLTVYVSKKRTRRRKTH
ncbi:MAG: HAD-IC family P-type ATPase [Clostridiales bacterium]|nr:HAD-IC family P-type ATPase [Clostridiales bacterium]